MGWLPTASLTMGGVSRPVYNLPVDGAALKAELRGRLANFADVQQIGSAEAGWAAAKALSLSGSIPIILVSELLDANFAQTSNWDHTTVFYFRVDDTYLVAPTDAELAMIVRGFSTAEKKDYRDGPGAARIPTGSTVLATPSETIESPDDEGPVAETPAPVASNEDGQTVANRPPGLASPVPGLSTQIVPVRPVAAWLQGLINSVAENLSDNITPVSSSTGTLGSLIYQQGGNDVVGPALPSGNFISTARDRQDLATLANAATGYVIDAGTAGVDGTVPVIGIASIGAASTALVPLVRFLPQVARQVGSVGAGVTGTLVNFVGRPVYRIAGAQVARLQNLVPPAVWTLLTGTAGYFVGKAVDVVIDFPDIVGGDQAQIQTWDPQIGEAVGVGQGGAWVTKVWYANNVPFVALSDGRIGAQRKTGAWRFWRPRKPVAVVYSDGVTDIKAAVKAGKALSKQASELKRFVDKYGPQPRKKRTAMPRIVDQNGKTVSIDNYDVR